MDRTWIEYRNRIIFDSDASSFVENCRLAREELIQARDAKMAAELAIDLASYLTRWIPGNEEGALDAQAAEQCGAFAALLAEWGEEALAAYVQAEIAQIKASNLVTLSREADAGRLNVLWGNDNGLGIMQAMRRGAVMVTTNPPIVNMARLDCPDYFDAVRDRINQAFPQEKVERRISRLTMEVVLNSCRALRRIFEQSGEQLGYVNYQVNPNLFEDSEAMAQEIFFAYEEMEKALGGKPNVLFKVPGTKASLETVRMVTARGIGVTITVNFSVAQSDAFAKVIQQGSAKRSYVVIMAGRLDGPVAEDLKTANVPDAENLARNASRAVTHKVYHDVLLKNGLDKTGILVASLRGPWNFDASFTANKASCIAISSFPDKWAEYDAKPRPIQTLVDEALPADTINLLRQSDVFTKAYEWEALSEAAFDTYLPVVQTLTAFVAVYDDLKAYMGA